MGKSYYLYLRYIKYKNFCVIGEELSVSFNSVQRAHHENGRKLKKIYLFMIRRRLLWANLTMKK